MLRVKRDSFGGPAGNAVPSLGEIGGRVFVLEAVATTALTRLLRHCAADGQTEHIEALRRAIERKCREANLPEAQIAAASEYAQELFKDAMERAGKTPVTGQ
ncbi:hypothetical protein FHT29_004526 [Rhizobium sp. SG741]|jgi:hypothetical protein|nr:hypothetical protein [Rhizobium sp. SG741]